MDQKQKDKTKKRIKELKEGINNLDNGINIKSATINRLQGEINNLLQRKFSLIGGAVELNRLLPEEDQFKEFITSTEEPIKEEEDAEK